MSTVCTQNKIRYIYINTFFLTSRNLNQTSLLTKTYLTIYREICTEYDNGDVDDEIDNNDVDDDIDNDDVGDDKQAYGYNSVNIT